MCFPVAKFWEISKNTFFTENLWATASVKKVVYNHTLIN